MMSGHDENPIFINKKNKDLMSRRLADLPSPMSDNISFLSYPHPLKWTSYLFHPISKAKFCHETNS